MNQNKRNTSLRKRVRTVLGGGEGDCFFEKQIDKGPPGLTFHSLYLVPKPA